ncbi:MAG: hypothetical protein GYA55_01190 [SAR324 cluster bacterium]|uniref:Flagellar protein FlgJ N-terminal domain-containing protein n=1 Tax=SAR324 cluster bacterium TaxID=2024889 RepID=A0A7X9FP90_9DELT|nr:hypothetical protein [SAR324 cluster bacterium]
MGSDTKSELIGSLLDSGVYKAQATRQAKALDATLKGTKRGYSEKEIEKASAQFEALLLQQMMSAMWKSIPNEGLLSGSREEAIYRDMLNQGLAESIATGPSVGIKNVVMKELKASEKK